MNREEALEVFSTVKERSEHFKECGCRFPLWTITERDEEAIGVAIEALQKDIERHEMVIRASERHLGLVRCKDCRYLDVWNLKTVYAVCSKHGITFDPFEDDTRTHFCAWGERREP